MEANIYTSYTETESESSSSESESEDNYINMEPGRDSSSSFFQNFLINNKEFEFQSFSNSSSDRHAAQTTTSPADELFYMGKLLPLHLPPRLLHHQIPNNKQQEEEEEYPFGGGGGGSPLFSTPTANTPFQSCNISPAESCHVSRELNPAEYFAHYNNNNNNNNNNNILSPDLLGQQIKKSRPPKQSKNNNNSSSSIGIGSKLKWAYLKSLFTTSGCAAVDQSQHLPKVKHYCHKSSAKVNTHAPPPPQAFGQIKSKKKTSSSDNYNNNIAKKENTTNNLVEGHHRHRRSFSGAFKRISKTKTKKSSSSSTNSCTADSKRCGGGSSSEIDSSIQAAIAHCKRSHKVDKERAFCSISASYI
ncbi:hypothetical protein ACP275_06G150200 [Erythranthe tilingii]